MSIKLVAVLFVLMLANQIVGVSYGAFKEGFSWNKLKYGMWKMLTALGGYAAIAFAAHYANDYINGIEYISGILLEPIAKYFLCVFEKLKDLISEDINDIILKNSIAKNMSSDIPEYFEIHSIPVTSSK